ncbi:hypothetical protein ACNI3K_08695 [Demequina sp. SO4-13]
MTERPPFSFAGERRPFVHPDLVGPARRLWNSAPSDPPFTLCAGVHVACEVWLQRLQTARIDLLQQHQPDPGTPVEETIGARHLHAPVGTLTAMRVSRCPIRPSLLTFTP